MTSEVSKQLENAAIPEPVIGMCRTLRSAGHKAWVVGGSLRDLLLQRRPKDWDLATTAKPAQLTKIFKRVIPTGIAHGTVTVLIGESAFEITTLRGEGAYSDSRRPDEVFFVDDIEQDLARRDFTVNALAYDPLDARLVDPFGGLADMTARLLRTVGAPEQRFSEDGLRVLRAARFAATLEFDLDPTTLAAIPGCLGAFSRVSAERVRDEWMRTMEAKTPSRAFEVMRESGILGVTCPELMEQVGCEQNRFHNYDVWKHSMVCMDASPTKPLQRVAALLHDLGKPRTRAHSDKTGDWTFYNHEAVGADMADEWLRRYRFSNDERKAVVHLVRHHLICYSSEWSDAAVRRFVRRVGTEHLDALMDLGRADAIAKGRPADGEFAALAELTRRIEQLKEEGAAFGTRDLAISGRDVITKLGVPPGPIVGRVLERLLERVLEEPKLNERDALLGLVEECARAAEPTA